MAIRSFADRRTEAVFLGDRPRSVPAELMRRLRVKLLVLDADDALETLAATPGNRLELLSGDRAGQYSVRVNQQWRLCFRWVDGDAYDVEFVDYH